MSCAGKCRYPSKQDAKAAFRRSRRFLRDPGRVRAYRCDQCGTYHLGHISPAVVSGWVSRAERYGNGAAA